jgi:hypothetical protein
MVPTRVIKPNLVPNLWSLCITSTNSVCFQHNPTYFLFGKEYTADLVTTALNSIGPLDLFAYSIIGTNGNPTQCKTNACMLQLFLILITDDAMYEELMMSKTNPTQAAMDEGAVGDKSEFWAKACSKFLDNDYPVPDFPIVDYPKVFIDDKINLEYDVKKCYSPRVNAADFRLWYKTASNTLATYKKIYDKSGMHSSDTTGGLEEYCLDFCNGEKHAAFFDALLQAHGTNCVEHHN